MTEAIIILAHMRGGCATVGDKVHALFRLRLSARKSKQHQPAEARGGDDQNIGQKPING
jgi:hypothetical protein